MLVCAGVYIAIQAVLTLNAQGQSKLISFSLHSQLWSAIVGNVCLHNARSCLFLVLVILGGYTLSDHTWHTWL